MNHPWAALNPSPNPHPPHAKLMNARLTCCLLAIVMVQTAQADDGPEYKLTFGQYHYSNGSSGQDFNLRRRANDTNAWLAYYRDRDFGGQARTGLDTSFDLAEGLSLQPSLQAATRGFLGGSVNLQWGDPCFAVIGWGRTNLRPYFNLNWDPNDAITVGAGWHGQGGRTVSITLISDDRLHTHQKDWHLYGRWPIAQDLRLTLDLMRKTGMADDGPVRAWGLSATLDWSNWFLRLAHDPKQNFSSLDANRLSVGLRL